MPPASVQIISSGVFPLSVPANSALSRWRRIPVVFPDKSLLLSLSSITADLLECSLLIIHSGSAAFYCSPSYHKNFDFAIYIFKFSDKIFCKISKVSTFPFSFPEYECEQWRLFSFPEFREDYILEARRNSGYKKTEYSPAAHHWVFCNSCL